MDVYGSPGTPQIPTGILAMVWTAWPYLGVSRLAARVSRRESEVSLLDVSVLAGRRTL
jgi:hypothetical protein